MRIVTVDPVGHFNAKTGVAALTDESNRARYFALNGVVSQFGLTLGTQLGAILIGFDFAVVALASAACFVATFLVTLVFMPSVRVATPSRTPAALPGVLLFASLISEPSRTKLT